MNQTWPAPLEPSNDKTAVRNDRLTAGRELMENHLSAAMDAHDLAITAVVRARPTYIVARGRVGNTDAFFKLFRGPQAARDVEQITGEMTYMDQYMREGSYRIVPLLLSLPALGLIATGAAPGEDLKDILQSYAPHARAEMIGRAGAWLAAYALPRRRTLPFNADQFLQGYSASRNRYRISAHRERYQFIDDVDRFIGKTAMDLNGRGLATSMCHSDFVARNLHYHERVMHGFDVSPAPLRPVVSAATHFLVNWQTFSDPPQETFWGLEREYCDAMAHSGIVSLEEWSATLPLYSAMRLQVAFRKELSQRNRPQRVHVLKRLLMDFLQNL